MVMKVFAKATASSKSPCRMADLNTTIFSAMEDWFSSSGEHFLTAVKLTKELTHLLSATAALLLKRSITKSPKLRDGISCTKFSYSRPQFPLSPCSALPKKPSEALSADIVSACRQNITRNRILLSQSALLCFV